MKLHQLRSLMQQAKIHPQRSAGQHFLLDESVVERMVEAAKIKKGDRVLEVGPGFGFLTNYLLEAGAEVTAVELDRQLAAWLTKHFADQPLTLVTEDILRYRYDQVFTNGKYHIVANLPYNITSYFFRQFLSKTPRPKSITVLIQREVAERIVAEPGEMSMLSLSVQWFCKPELLFTVPPESFHPRPAVQSAVLQCTNITPGVEPELEQWFFRLAKMGFVGKRKQLRNTLSAGLQLQKEAVDSFLIDTGIPPEARPQDLSLEEWLILAKNIPDTSK